MYDYEEKKVRYTRRQNIQFKETKQDYILEEFIKLKNKKTYRLIKKWAEDLDRHLMEKRYMYDK